MKLKSISIPALVAIAVTCLPAFAVEKQAGDKASPDPMTAVLKEHEGTSFEPTFLSLMIHHHQSGKKMALVAMEKATDADLKQLAAKIEKQQSEEITTMTKWLKEWHGKSPDSSMVPDETKKMEASTSASLGSKSGVEFDRFFATSMAEHHAGGIAMAKLALDHAEHAEVKAMAKKMIAMQEEEKEKLLKLAEK